MAPAPLPLKIIESSRVAPPPGTTPDHASLPFTYLDVFWTVLPPVERLFFYDYPHSTEQFISSLLPSLKSSLSTALKTYYFLAGGYRRTPSTDDKFEHYYIDGDVVSFTVAECNGQFEHLANDHERDVSQLNCLVPQLPKSEEVQPLFAVQVTIFPGHGIVIGIAVHHTACDGHSSMQFMHTWAEICLSGASVSSRVPSFDRALVSDPSNLYSYFNKKVEAWLKYIPKDAIPEKAPSELVLATFTLGQEQIQRLKKLISAKAEERKTLFRCSTIVVSFAYVWTCFVRAKRVDSNKRVGFAISADFRARLQPPLPMEYFGNCVGSCMSKAIVADLIREDGFIVAAEVVGKAIDELVKCSRIPTDVYDEFASLIGTVPILSVAGSPKFKVYDVDFGLGRPKKVEIVSTVKTGAMSVAESGGEQGGVEIGLAFPKDEMDCFKKYFFDGLKLLCSD